MSQLAGQGGKSYYGFWLDKGAVPSDEPLTEEERAYIDDLIKDAGGKRAFRTKQCYKNSQRLMLRDSDKRLQYWEGFFMTNDIPIPIKHAWVTINGKVVDVTAEALTRWHKRKKMKRAEAFYYLGVTIPFTDLLTHLGEANMHEGLTEYPTKMVKYLGLEEELRQSDEQRATGKTESK